LRGEGEDGDGLGNYFTAPRGGMGKKVVLEEEKKKEKK
jgi:hypothetical protein